MLIYVVKLGSYADRVMLVKISI